MPGRIIYIKESGINASALWPCLKTIRFMARLPSTIYARLKRWLRAALGYRPEQHYMRGAGPKSGSKSRENGKS